MHTVGMSTTKAWQVTAPTNAGNYAQQLGWRVQRTADGYVVFTGDKRTAQRWCRDLNR